jgi:hypothetical protein
MCRKPDRKGRSPTKRACLMVGLLTPTSRANETQKTEPVTLTALFFIVIVTFLLVDLVTSGIVVVITLR